MTSPAFESLLARVLVDAGYREQFLFDPGEAGRRAGLTEEECAALVSIDRIGLEMAAASLARKRGNRPTRRRGAIWRLIGRARGLTA